ncbi:MAG TPA: hypothetical protein VGM67_01650 [Gemmatimonadaceae bacterium]|jgi:predicted TIM-barrel fold metal-dependent hydrolase
MRSVSVPLGRARAVLRRATRGNGSCVRSRASDRDYLQNNLYVTSSGMFLPHYLERAVAIVGTDRLLFSADYP